METIQLYKKRDFSGFINDTILFFRTNGKEYFRNYLVTNGWIILIFCALYLIYSKLSGILSNPFGNGFEINGDISTLPVVLLVLLVITMIVYSIYSINFPVIYLQHKSKNPDDQISSKELSGELKDYFFPTLKFGFFSLFTIVPLALIALALNVALAFIIIGIPLLFIVIPSIMLWYTQSLYVYLNEDLDFFGSLGKGWKILTNQFWHKIGASLIVFICLAVVDSIFVLVPTLLLVTNNISTGSSITEGNMGTIMIMINIVSTVISFFVNNIIFVQQGIIYYSSIEHLENTQSFTDIDNIGKDEE